MSIHPADLADLTRRIENLIRQGTIECIQRDQVRVRSGKLLSDWIYWLTFRAGNARTWWRPSIGEQVLILSIGGEMNPAFALPAIYSDAAPMPADGNVHHTVYPDGAVVEYDPDISEMKVIGVSTVIIEASTRITLDTPDVICTHHLQCEKITVTDGGTLTGTFNHSNGSIVSNGVTVHTHVHGGVKSGGSNTGGPQ